MPLWQLDFPNLTPQAPTTTNINEHYLGLHLYFNRVLHPGTDAAKNGLGILFYSSPPPSTMHDSFYFDFRHSYVHGSIESGCTSMCVDTLKRVVTFRSLPPIQTGPRNL